MVRRSRMRRGLTGLFQVALTAPRTPEPLTLGEFVLDGAQNEKMYRLHGTVCKDIGATVTIKTSKGVVRRLSERKGEDYKIEELLPYAPWAPNNIRPVIGITYLKEGNQPRVYTYLDERFNDIVKTVGVPE